jgi:hypothetical protein
VTIWKEILRETEYEGIHWIRKHWSTFEKRALGNRFGLHRRRNFISWTTISFSRKTQHHGISILVRNPLTVVILITIHHHIISLSRSWLICSCSDCLLHDRPLFRPPLGLNLIITSRGPTAFFQCWKPISFCSSKFVTNMSIVPLNLMVQHFVAFVPYPIQNFGRSACWYYLW